MKPVISYKTAVKPVGMIGGYLRFGGAITIYVGSQNDPQSYTYTFAPGNVVNQTMDYFQDAIKQEIDNSFLSNDKVLRDAVYRAYGEYMQKLLNGDFVQ